VGECNSQFLHVEKDFPGDSLELCIFDRIDC
jgi:hypothetical protein